MLTQILDKAGVFPGHKLCIDHEAYFFLQLNKYIFNQASITWDNLYNYQFCSEFFVQHVADFLRRHLSSNRRMVFLGMNKFLRYQDLRFIDFPWCFKDPRTTVTLNIWKRIFPDSKILFIYRNPVDVAFSLKKREEKLRRAYILNFERKFKENILYHNYIYTHSMRVENLSEGIRLWEEYNSYALKYRDQYRDEFYSLCYEDFLEKPEELLKEVLEFAGQYGKVKDIPELIAGVNKDRRFSFTSNDELAEVFESVKSSKVATALGYNKIRVFA